MKKIVLKTESCIGCGACVGIDEEHFDFSEEGYSEVISQENLESTSLQDAIDACPVAIISLEDAEENEESTEGHTCSCEGECTCTKENHCGCKGDSHENESCHCEGECHCKNESSEEQL